MRAAALLCALLLSWPGAAADPSLPVAGLRAAALEMAESMERVVAEVLARTPPAERDGVCRNRSAAMAAARGAAMDGVDVRRIAAQPRNPADRPDAWEADRLRHLTALAAAGADLETLEAAEIVEAGAGAFMLRYLRLIPNGERCRTCHDAAAVLGAFSVRRPM